MKITKAKIIALGVFVCICLTSCDKKEVYPYLHGFSSYMKYEHDVDVSSINDNMFFILPLSDCESCQDTPASLELLSSIKKPQKNLTVILVGTTQNPSFTAQIKALGTSVKILRDEKNSIYNFQTGLSKPIFLHIKKEVVVYYLNIAGTKLEKVHAYLSSQI